MSLHRAMLLHRTRTAAASVTAFFLLLGLAPFATAGSEGAQVGGTTSARIKILDVELTNVPIAGDVSAGVGVATGDATTTDRPFASIAFEGARVGGENLAGESVTSDDADNSTRMDVPFSAAGSDGRLTIAELAASATEAAAMSTLRGLEGELTLDALGLTSAIGGQGIDSEVTPNLSTSGAGVDIGPIALQLGDLLPAELLEALPFSTVVALAGELDLDVTATLREVRGVLRQVNDHIDAIQAKVAELEAAQAELDALVAHEPEIQALQAEVAAAAAASATAMTSLEEEQAVLADLVAQGEVLEADLARCTTACDTLQADLDAVMASIEAQQQEVAAAEAALAAATATLEDAEGALAAAIAAAGEAIRAASALVDQVQAELENLLDDLEDLLVELPDLSALIDGALDALAGAPLLSVRRLELGVDTLADAERGIGSAACSVEGVNILGSRFGAMSCAALSDRFDELESGIWGVLSDLPVAGAIPRPSVQGLVTSESGSTAPDARGHTSSGASITALRLGMPSLELEAVIDSLIANLTQQLEDLLGGTPLSPQVNDAVQSVLDQLDSLPTGTLLQGLRTVGLKAAVGGLASTSDFVSRAGTAPMAKPGSSGGTPVSNPQERAPLPFTGGGYVLLFLVLGLFTTVAGATARLIPAIARRRGTTIDSR